MRTGRAAALAALFLTVGTPATTQSQKAGAQQELKAAYAKLAAALKRKDIEAAMKFYAPDYTRQDSGGVRVNRAQYKAALLRVMKSQQTVRSLHIRIDSLKVTGKAAAAATTVFLKARTIAMDSRNRPIPGNTYEMAATWPARDVWIKTAAGWRIKRSKMLAPTRANMAR